MNFITTHYIRWLRTAMIFISISMTSFFQFQLLVSVHSTVYKNNGKEDVFFNGPPLRVIPAASSSSSSSSGGVSSSSPVATTSTTTTKLKQEIEISPAATTSIMISSSQQVIDHHDDSKMKNQTMNMKIGNNNNYNSTIRGNPTKEIPQETNSSIPSSSTPLLRIVSKHKEQEPSPLIFDYNKHNYFQRAWLGRNEFQTAQTLPPMQVMMQYIQEHSNTQLNQEWIQCQMEWNQHQQQQEETTITSNVVPIGKLFQDRLTISSSTRYHRHTTTNTTSNYTATTTTLPKVQQHTPPPPQYCQSLTQRRFMVGVYSCPLEAGNRLHRFMNALLWAVATNRTLLWRYYTHDICLHEYHEGHDACLGLQGSHPNDCQDVLQLASWVPSYDEWNIRLELFQTNNYTIHRAQILEHKKDRIDPLAQPYDVDEYDEEEDGTVQKDNTIIPPLLIRPGSQLHPDPGNILSKLNTTSLPRSLLSQQSNWERLYQLVNVDYLYPSPYPPLPPPFDHNSTSLLHPNVNRIYFVYGMMFESLFTLYDDSYWPTNTTTADPTSSNHSINSTPGIAIGNHNAVSSSSSPSPFHSTHHDTFFLHSRHPENRMDGSYTWPEWMCIEKLLGPAENRTRPCTFYLLSDRALTIQLLRSQLERNTSCTVEAVAHDNQSNTAKKESSPVVMTANKSPSWLSEHGPFAGRGYWKDWALAVQARTGFISFQMFPRPLVRTSTALIREVVEFRRVLEYLQNPQQQLQATSQTDSIARNVAPLSPFLQCRNPWRDK